MKLLAPSLWKNDAAGGTCASLPPNLRADCEKNIIDIVSAVTFDTVSPVIKKAPKVTCETIDIQCVLAPCPPWKICKDEKGNAVNEDGTPWVAPKPTSQWPPISSSPVVVASGQSDPTKHPVVNLLAAVGILAVLIYLLNHYKKF